MRENETLSPPTHSEESFNTNSPSYETSSALDNRLAGLRLQPFGASLPSVETTGPSVQATETTRTSVQGNGLKIYKNITRIMHTYVELKLGENEYAEPIYQGESTTNSNAPKDQCCRRLFSGTRNKLTISLICILVSGIDLKWSQNMVKLMHS